MRRPENEENQYCDLWLIIALLTITGQGGERSAIDVDNTLFDGMKAVNAGSYTEHK